MGKVDTLKKLAVALGYGTQVNEYSGNTVVKILKEIAVKMGITTDVKNIKEGTIERLLNYIAENYGSEEKEPYDLVITNTNATVTVKRKGKAISAGTDILYNGDKLKITAVADDGYTLETLTVNGTAIESGDEIVVSGKVTIVANATT